MNQFAINHNTHAEIYTYFHPIISIQDKSIVALEALSRYRLKSNETLISIDILMGSMELEEDIQDMDKALFDDCLEFFLEFNDNLECIYLLNDEGIQVTRTQSVYENQENKHFLFQPAIKGADHSLKPYYIDSEGFHHFHVTSPYISKASGKSCITFSKRFNNDGNAYILCADFADISDFTHTFNQKIIDVPGKALV